MILDMTSDQEMLIEEFERAIGRELTEKDLANLEFPAPDSVSFCRELLDEHIVIRDKRRQAMEAEWARLYGRGQDASK